jgi:fatty acid desaturase
MAEKKDDWFRCEIDRKTLKQLSKRNNRPGYIQFGGIFTVLIALAVAVVSVWGTWWAVPVFIVYSIVWSFANAMGHESCHGTPFRSYWMNEVLLYVSSWMVSWEPITVRWVHARHHSYTSIVGDDAEYLLPNAIRWRDMFELLTGWNTNWQYNKELVQLSCGYTNHFIQLSVPESEIKKVFRNARIFLTSFLLIIVISIYAQSWLLIVLLLLPRWVGEPMHGILRITQHGALATGIRDHRKTTRTMYVNPLLQFFYCNMNYHIEHHMFPMVPFHSLEKLHRELKTQMPEPSRGVTAAMGEVFSTMREQRKRSDYVWSK